MKHLLTLAMCLIFSLSFAQSSFEELWEEADNLEQEGLTKSALEKVTQIATKAKKENNRIQHIKTLLYESKYALILEEDAQLHIVNSFKKRISESSSPEKNMLQNLLANLYWDYFQVNRYRFYNRTNLSHKDSDDFRTWDLETLFQEIDHLFRVSLENEKKLQAIDLSAIKELLIIHPESNSRPTLYDFLSYNALNFYKTDENNITRPSYKFEINNPDYLCEGSMFTKIKLSSKDSTSLQLQALKIYQDLLQFHMVDASPYAYVKADIERLKFVYDKTHFEGKEGIYLETLANTRNQWDHIKTKDIAASYDYEIANLYFQQGLQFEGGSEENRWKLKEAIAICERAITSAPESVGAKNCALLKTQITQPSLNLVVENYFPIEHPSRILVTYKNIPSLEFSIYEFNQDNVKSLNKPYRKEEQLRYIQNLKSKENWSVELPNEGDYQVHSTEVVVPKLPQGYYLILAKQNDETFAFKTIQVTSMGLVITTMPNENTYQIVDRMNGQPISGASVKINYENNNGNPKSVTVTTDEWGIVHFKKSSTNFYDINLEVTKNNETVYFEGGYLYGYYDRERDTQHLKGFIFTDRSIYRPEQTVYFKGMVLKSKESTSVVVTKESVTAHLFNVNGEEVSMLELVTNEFGSVAGEFILPNDGLTGGYHIQLRNKNSSLEHTIRHFSVEEYKRPKFEAQFDPVTETFKVNDTITITGLAQAYAGSNITGAKVVYRVYREVEYPRGYRWFRPMYSSKSQEITHGETITNEKGKFDINFKAIPDLSASPENLPIFHYKVTADVTDINGETRSTTTTVNVGYHAMKAAIVMDSSLDKSNKNNKLTIDIKNLNGQEVTASGHIFIHKLVAPSQVLRPRPWKAPDYQTLSKEEFKALFPHDAYEDESINSNWEKGQQVFQETFDTKSSKEVALGNLKKWEQGLYLIELFSKDKFGQTVKDQLQVTVSDFKSQEVKDNELFSASLDKKEYQVGNTVELTLASAADNLTVYMEVEKNGNIVDSQRISLNHSVKTVKVPVDKNDMGGFVIYLHYAIYNHFDYRQLMISVPYPKTDLEIETQTFRDKLQPGQDETWSFKIKGPKGEKVSAELLASMYDASLDQFKPHDWTFDPLYLPTYRSVIRKGSEGSFKIGSFRSYVPRSRGYDYIQSRHDQWNWFGLYFGNNYDYYRGNAIGLINNVVPGVQVVEDSAEIEEEVTLRFESGYVAANDLDDTDYYIRSRKAKVVPESFKTKEQQEPKGFIQIRKNLQETAFFFPQLQTDPEGNVTFSFTSPEALTKWKLQLLAHTKNLESTIKTMEAITQKELMVLPNAPRFLREGDTIVISTKISNLSDKTLSGQAELQLFDAITGKNITEMLILSNAIEDFSIEKEGNTQASWKLSIPETVQAVQYKVIAKAGEFSDGEQNALPILSNRMLVTETLPMWIRSNETRTFVLDKLKTNSSATLKNHGLTLEMTSNPAWYAVQALPYLMEYPYECNEQTFSRYYANALASHIANSNPRIQEVFNQWKNSDALLSNLEKNQELKSMLIQETPWLRDAQSETEQKKRIGLLFDLNKMNHELSSALRKLENNQLSNGAWPWFNGGRENRYITQHIMTGFGHLKHLNVTSNAVEISTIKKAINYLDTQFVEEYEDLKKYDKDVDLSKDHLSYTQLHYLYMRSFFPEIEKPKKVQEITMYYLGQIKSHWLSRSLYAKGLMALIMDRANDKTTSGKILKSLKENSITSNELGMYWKENKASWFWYQAPIETHTLLIEAFSEIENDTKTVDNLKVWLLKNKQTNKWETTKATTEAVYALLLQGSDWLSITDAVEVLVGNQKIEPSQLENVSVEAGTGYYKTSWEPSEITPDKATVTLTKKGNGIAWGSLYWQYFEDLDKITSAETPLKLKKKLFLKTNTDKGEQLSEITESTSLKVGDLVRVRIELRSDRDMEFVHMKDMRAAGLEPINVLSQYKWQDGLGYYESPKDAATNFFFDYLPKGVYVFEYDLRVNIAGNMSNGITTIQCMYAPEFTSHSEGVRIKVN